MLMMGLTVLRLTDEEVELAISLPPGFDIERIDGSSLRVNGETPAKSWLCEPKRSRPSDLFRAFRASFSRSSLENLVARDGRFSLRLTGVLKGGARVEGVLPIPEALRSMTPSTPAKGWGGGSSEV